MKHRIKAISIVTIQKIGFSYDYAYNISMLTDFTIEIDKNKFILETKNSTPDFQYQLKPWEDNFFKTEGLKPLIGKAYQYIAESMEKWFVLIINESTILTLHPEVKK